MYQIGVVGNPSRKRFQIVNHLEGTQIFRVRLFSQLQEADQYLKAELLSGLIFVQEELNDQTIQSIDDLLNANSKLVILCALSSLTLQQI